MAEIAVTRELVKELAKAARLILSEEETDKYTQQLSVILDAFKELDEVSTDGVEPSYHPIEIKDSLRDDKPEQWFWDPLENVKDHEGKYIRGPRIK
ncbi:MAG: Asp-tRNA(Asn)/Glu-tRNA(Gln) amidotransferase subunit GatC [Candidatus Bathyarchaeota archaeon]|nr:Asp-tRNA(Asn)/Glu-tRNA(Gln) amidotransferase subunit GatC [Candidatus Bathyarchaeota archaeon]